MQRCFRGGFAAFSCVLVLLLLTGGCGRGPVATVGPEKITEEEFIAELERVAGATVLRQMVREQMIESEAAAQGISLTDEQLATEAKIKQLQVEKQAASRGINIAGDQAFAQWVVSTFGSQEAFLRQVRQDSLVSALCTKGVTVSEAEVERIFKANQELLGQPPRYTIRQIVVSSKSKADELWAQLRQSKEDFVAIAQQNSESQLPGGLRPPTPLESIYPAQLREAVKGLAVGELAGPMEAAGAWWIIKLEDKTPAIKATLKDPIVRGLVEHVARSEKGMSDEELSRELMAKYRVNVLWPEYDSVEQDFQIAGELPDFDTKTPTPPEPGKGPPGATQQPSQQTKPGADTPAKQPAKPSGKPAGGEGADASKGPAKPSLRPAGERPTKQDG